VRALAFVTGTCAGDRYRRQTALNRGRFESLLRSPGDEERYGLGGRRKAHCTARLRPRAERLRFPVVGADGVTPR
jgi:hypothetical protein